MLNISLAMANPITQTPKKVRILSLPFKMSNSCKAKLFAGVAHYYKSLWYYNYNGGYTKRPIGKKTV